MSNAFEGWRAKARENIRKAVGDPRIGLPDSLIDSKEFRAGMKSWGLSNVVELLESEEPDENGLMDEFFPNGEEAHEQHEQWKRDCTTPPRDTYPKGH